MTARKSDGRKRDSGPASSGAGSSSSSDDRGSSAGLFDSSPSGGVESEGGAVDERAGRAEIENDSSTSDSGHSSVGDDRSDDSGERAGAGADSGGGGDRVADATEKRKRGRPIGSTTQKLSEDDSPRVVPLTRLRGGRKKKAHDYTVPFAKGFKVLYEMPRYAGYGDHWPISDGDSLLLGGKLNDVVQQLPKGQVHKLAEFFDKYINPYLPIASFATAMYLVTEPRITLSKKLAQEARKRQADATQETEPTQPISPTGSAKSNGSMHEGAERATTSSIDSERLSNEAI